MSSSRKTLKLPTGSSLADLSKADKQKVSRLIYKLVELGKEHEQALEDLVQCMLRHHLNKLTVLTFFLSSSMLYVVMLYMIDKLSSHV